MIAALHIAVLSFQVFLNLAPLGFGGKAAVLQLRFV